VLVVGAGIIGLAVARELLQRGASVTVLDKGSVGHGCSFGNAGWLTPCFAMPLPQPGLWRKAIKWMFDPKGPLYIRPLWNGTFLKWLWRFVRSMNERHFARATEALTALSKRSLDAYQSLSLRYAFGFRRDGLLLTYETSAGRVDALRELEWAQRFGVPGEAVDAERAHSEEPTLEGLLGAVLFPQEAHVEPLAAVEALSAEVGRLGGAIRTDAEVYDFEVSGGVVTHVLTTGGSIPVNTLVLAAGAWSRHLGRRAGLQVPILGGKGYSVIVDRPGFALRRPTMLLERKIALTPRENGSLRVAGTLELVMDDLALNGQRVEALWAGATSRLPLLKDKAFQQVWRGLRPCTPDGVPIIGPAPEHRNVFIVAGHQMLGLQTALGSAEVAANAVEGIKTDWVDDALFRAQRFQ
jgi:D-amino-acid dehydrogenase